MTEKQALAHLIDPAHTSEEFLGAVGALRDVYHWPSLAIDLAIAGKPAVWRALAHHIGKRPCVQ